MNEKKKGFTIYGKVIEEESGTGISPQFEAFFVNIQ